MFGRIAAAALLAASLAAPCLAEDLITVDGSSHTCEILRVDEDGVQARGTLKSGDVVELKVPAARLDPHCFYALRDKAIGNDGKARLKLALWAVENGLFAQAKIQVRKAAAADPKLLEDLEAGKYPEIREKIADRILASSEADVGAGRFDVARQKIEIVLARFSDTQAGDKACAAIKSLDEKQSAAEAKADAEAQAKMDEAAKKAAEVRTKRLAAVDEECTKGKALATEGLTEDDHGKALDLLEKALSRGDAALKKLDSMQKELADDAELVKSATERRTKIVKAMVKVRIHRADLYIWRGSLPNAKKELDKARELDPSNPEIDAANERLVAADDDDALELRWLRDRRQSGQRFNRGARGR
jgi:tetratricopeptide (TPR) repeat protein